LSIFLAASALFVYLVAVKFMHLLSYPKTVNVDFNFNTSVPFPAVTICNESPYRYSFYDGAVASPSICVAAVGLWS